MSKYDKKKCVTNHVWYVIERSISSSKRSIVYWYFVLTKVCVKDIDGHKDKNIFQHIFSYLISSDL